MSNISLSTVETIMLYAFSKNKTMLRIMINNLTKQQRNTLFKACKYILTILD
jgi:hypothetical protein